MTPTQPKVDPVLGRLVFHCRPKPVGRLLRDLKRSYHCRPGVITSLVHAGEALTAYFSPMGFLIPLVIVLGVLQVTLGPRRVAGWPVVLLAGITLALGTAWFWFGPRRDCLEVHEKGLRWRIWLSRSGLFPSHGTILLQDIAEFFYRSDWSEPRKDVYRKKMTVAEKMNVVLAEIYLPSRDAGFRFTEGTERIVRNLLARFEPEDTQRLLDLLSQQPGIVVKKV